MRHEKQDVHVSWVQQSRKIRRLLQAARSPWGPIFTHRSSSLGKVSGWPHHIGTPPLKLLSARERSEAGTR